MKASDLTKSLQALIVQKEPAFLWDAPGVGKSYIVKQIADEKGVEFIDLRLALMDPTDLKGIPFYDKETHTALWASPAFLPREGEGILFLDELNSFFVCYLLHNGRFSNPRRTPKKGRHFLNDQCF